MNRPQREAVNIAGLGSVLTVPVVSHQFRAHPEAQVQEASPAPQPVLAKQSPVRVGAFHRSKSPPRNIHLQIHFQGSGEAAPGAGPGRGEPPAAAPPDPGSEPGSARGGERGRGAEPGRWAREGRWEGRGEPGRGDGPGRTPRLPRPPGVASLRLCPAAGRCPGGAPPGGGSVRASGRSQASLRRGVWLGAKAEGNAAQPPPTCSALARPGPAARSRWGPVTGGGSEMPELLP